ncbi:MAG: DUF3592 domain-containing protein [Gammaproteobacteria bacterium]
MRVFTALLGLLFGGAFAVVGLSIASQTAYPTFTAWYEMRDWQPEYAELLDVSGGYNSTEASYRYTVDGVAYRNDRVYVSTFKDNIGSYHQKLYDHLRWSRDNHEPVTVWYDPNNPSRSVLDRDMRWGLFALMAGFCSVFILVGLTVCYVSLHPTKATREQRTRLSLTQLRRQWKNDRAQGRTQESFWTYAQQQAAAFQDRNNRQTPVRRSTDGAGPWLDNKAWRDNRIRSGAKTSLYAVWALAMVWNGITLPLMVPLSNEINKGNHAALIGLAFPLGGLVLLWLAWKQTRDWLRYGAIELVMDPFSGAIGGHVGGTLFIRQGILGRPRFKIELECVYSYESGSGDNRSRDENVKWAAQGFANSEPSGRGVRLTFRFDVPEELPEADVEQRGAYHFWRLRLTSEGSGADIKRDYNIPVFNTGEQSKSIRHDLSAEAESVRKEQAEQLAAAVERGHFADTPLARAFRYDNLGSKHIFYYPMFRNKALSLIAWIFAPGFGAGVFFMNSMSDGAMGIAIFVFSVPFALVALCAGIASIYLPFNNLTVTLAERKITAVRRLLFIPIGNHCIYGRDIRDIEIKSSGSTGQGVKKIEHYKLIARTGNGQNVTIAEDIDGEGLAEELREFIAERIGFNA